MRIFKRNNVWSKRRTHQCFFFEYGQRAVTAGKKKIYYLW